MSRRAPAVVAWVTATGLGLALSGGATSAETGSAAPSDADARAQYLLHCGGCHLPDGRGAPPEVPTLRANLGRLLAYPDGRRYLARVPGASQAPLSDAGLAAVLNWMLAEFNGDTMPADMVPLTAEEVAEARAQVLADPLRERARIWAAHGLDGY